MAPRRAALRLADRPVLRRALVPVSAFVGVALAGVVGFVLIGDVGPIEAAFWVLDPTSIELHFADHAGPDRLAKAYAIVVRAGLVVAGRWIGETAVSAAFGGQISRELKTIRDRRRVMGLDGHVIVCGYGMFGQTIASRLSDRGRDVVAIETDADQFDRVERDGHVGIRGDARREETLDEAGIDDAAALVAAIDDSNANIQTAIAASQLAPDVRIVVRVGDAMYESLARRAGADEVVIPEVASGERAVEGL